MDLSGAQLSQIDAELQAIEQEFTEIEHILFANASLTERLESTGVLSEHIAWDHAVMGSWAAPPVSTEIFVGIDHLPRIASVRQG